MNERKCQEREFDNYLNKNSLMRDGEAKAQRCGGMR